MHQISLRLIRAEGEGGFWEGVGLTPPPQRHAFLLLGTHVLHPIYLFFREFLLISPPKIPVPAFHAHLCLLSCLAGTGISYGQTLLPIPSVMPCPPQSLVDFLLSSLVSHTPLLLSTLCSINSCTVHKLPYSWSLIRIFKTRKC